MRILTVLMALLLPLATGCVTRWTPRATETTLQFAVNGVAIGTPFSAVRSAFGQPTTVESGKDDECGSGEWTKLTYPGLVIRSAFPDRFVVKNPPTVPYVTSIDVRDARWPFANGLAVGSRREVVIQVLGEPEYREQEGGAERIYYSLADFDCGIGFVLVNGIVVEMGISEAWC